MLLNAGRRIFKLAEEEEEEGKEEEEERQERGGEEESGGCYRCRRGAPCDDLYCSVVCRDAALVGGHGLICVGGSEEGR